jgi:DNA-binding transcriptional ArsR family regulator
MDKKKALSALAALGQETRLDVFRLVVRLAPEGLPAGEIAQRLGVVQNTMSAHLAVLARAGLVSADRQGRVIKYTAGLANMRELLSFLMQDCCQGAPDICVPLLDLVICNQKSGEL